MMDIVLIHLIKQLSNPTEIYYRLGERFFGVKNMFFSQNHDCSLIWPDFGYLKRIFEKNMKSSAKKKGLFS